MANRLDAVTVREYTDRDGNKKSAFTRIGVAFETRNGWALSLEALPLPTMGERGLETRILLMPPKPRDDAPRQQRQPSYSEASGGRSSYDDPDDTDSIPF